MDNFKKTYEKKIHTLYRFFTLANLICEQHCQGIKNTLCMLDDEELLKLQSTLHFIFKWIVTSPGEQIWSSKLLKSQ